MVFKKLLGAFGVGGPSVDTVLSSPDTRPGATLEGRVRIQGGDHDVTIEHIALGLVTRVEVEGGDSEYDATVEFHRLPVSDGFALPAKSQRDIPFQFPVPWETPITTVYGQHLHGMTMGLRTELAVARAVDKGDLDAVRVHPLAAQELVLGALERLGFRFKGADLESGHLRGVHQTLPFYQEIEFYAAPQYAHACTEAEVTFVANPHGVDVIVEVDKRGGLFSGGHDVYHHFQVPHFGAEQTDWAGVVDGWFQRAVLAHAGHHGFGGHGHADHGHHGHGGGLGAVAAGVAVGAVGGYVVGEVVDEAFEEAFEEDEED